MKGEGDRLVQTRTRYRQLFGHFGRPSPLHLVGSAGTLLPSPPLPGGTRALSLPPAGTLLPPLHHQLAPYCYPSFTWVSPLSAGTLLLPTFFRFPEDLYGYLLGATHPLRIGYSGGLGFSPLLFLLCP